MLNVIRSGLYVVSRSGANVCVAKDPLNHHVRYSESVEIAPKTSACCVPAVPLSDATVALVGMVRFLVVRFCLST